MKNRKFILTLFSSLGVFWLVGCSDDDTSDNQGAGGLVDSGRADVGVGGVSVRGGSNTNQDGSAAGGASALGAGGAAGGSSAQGGAATDGGSGGQDAGPDVHPGAGGGAGTQDASSDGYQGAGGSAQDASSDGYQGAGGSAEDASSDSLQGADAGADGGGTTEDAGAGDAADATESDGSLDIQWNAFLPLAVGVPSDAGGGVAPDVTGHHYDAVYPTGISFAGSSMVFGSGNPIVSIPPVAAVPAVDLTSSYSISVWVKMTATEDWRTFVSADGINVSEFYLQKRKDTGRFAFTLSYSDTNEGALTPCYASSAITPSANTLYHVVATRDASTGVGILYVNGTESGRRTCAVSEGVGWAADTFGIGHGKYGGANVDFFSGNISGLGFVNRVLTASEVAILYGRGVDYRP